MAYVGQRGQSHHRKCGQLCPCVRQARAWHRLGRAVQIRRHLEGFHRRIVRVRPGTWQANGERLRRCRNRGDSVRHVRFRNRVVRLRDVLRLWSLAVHEFQRRLARSSIRLVFVQSSGPSDKRFLRQHREARLVLRDDLPRPSIGKPNPNHATAAAARVASSMGRRPSGAEIR